MEERERKRKVWGTEGETRWREGFGSPKNFGVAPMPDPQAPAGIKRAMGVQRQRHPRRRKMCHRNPRGDKNKEVGG